MKMASQRKWKCCQDSFLKVENCKGSVERPNLIFYYIRKENSYIIKNAPQRIAYIVIITYMFAYIVVALGACLNLCF